MNTENDEMSLLALANVEALAGELGEVVIECNSSTGYCGIHRGQCWKDKAWWIPVASICSFTGNMSDRCCTLMS